MKLRWDQVGERFYETGCKNGVLYVGGSGGVYGKGVAWSGLISVTESPSGAEPTPIYADDMKYLNLISAEDFAATIEAYTYPDEFTVCDGTASLADGVTVGQQTRKPFALAYRTAIGNDSEGTDHGYKLHIIYGATAAPSEKAYSTINDSPEAMTLSWELSTTPVEVPGMKPTAILTINSTKVDADKLAALEAILFGSESADARLPLPAEIKELFEGSAPQPVSATYLPANNATAVETTSTITITLNNDVLEEKVTLVTQEGVLVPATNTVNGKVITITPNDELAASTTYMIIASGIVDIYGQALTTAVTKFTTA